MNYVVVYGFDKSIEIPALELLVSFYACLVYLHYLSVAFDSRVLHADQSDQLHYADQSSSLDRSYQHDLATGIYSECPTIEGIFDNQTSMVLHVGERVASVHQPMLLDLRPVLCTRFLCRPNFVPTLFQTVNCSHRSPWYKTIISQKIVFMFTSTTSVKLLYINVPTCSRRDVLGKRSFRDASRGLKASGDLHLGTDEGLSASRQAGWRCLKASGDLHLGTDEGLSASRQAGWRCISNIQSCSPRVSAEKSSFRPAYVAGTATTDVHGGLFYCDFFLLAVSMDLHFINQAFFDVVRGVFIFHFNKILEALCKISADLDPNVQNATNLLDRLGKIKRKTCSKPLTKHLKLKTNKRLTAYPSHPGACAVGTTDLPPKPTTAVTSQDIAKRVPASIRASMLNNCIRADGQNTSSFLTTRVPEGYLPVYVGDEMERFIVSVDLLNHPVFNNLLNKSAREYVINKKASYNKMLHCMLLICNAISMENTCSMIYMIVVGLSGATSIRFQMNKVLDGHNQHSNCAFRL
ncbi:hypothetical protein CTI12_AA219920 [Artemisia annua]|uniref:Uncharacterized protein n=1 Tax=Artemisia annua TaxID=35608 RepID=A0A2U1NWT5_ARTAN|nr:hypothetical protein CTI12_AA219920 [Artemisia annua]